MTRLGKEIFIFACLFQFTLAPAQDNTNSPYSRFGIGELNRAGFDRNRALGNLGLSLRDNNQLNYVNPASYTAQDTLSFLFDFGMNSRYVLHQTKELTRPSSNINIDHLAIGFPFSRWWGFSIGIMPYSHVGYNIIQEDYLNGVGAVDYLYQGSGGLNRLYLGTALEFLERVSLGMNFSCIFGDLQRNRSVNFPFKTDFAVSEVESRTVINGFVYSFGLQYEERIAGDYRINVGLIFDKDASLDAERYLTIRNTFPGTIYSAGDSLVLNPDFILDEDTLPGILQIPGKAGGGVSFSYREKVLVGFDYFHQDWSNAGFFNETKNFTSSSSMHLGLEITPDREALRGYWKRMHYRFGGYHENSYLQIRSRQLRDYGISFGMGLPFKGDKTSFNLACNLGKRGTMQENLIQEKYVLLTFSVILHDFWFYKRKFE